MQQRLSKTDLETWWMLAWMLQGERNEVVHGHRARNASCLLEDAELYLMEYKNITKMKGLPTKCLVQRSSWEAPLVDHLKLNVNADVDLTAGWIGIEAVIQHSNGTICRAISSKFQGHFGVYIVDCIELRDSL
ncbi:hypothetical protein TorRG33x02_168060 [Trema orientale]|uniref:RNase H type-1 domain-containing protein n=1 Tax=Trema orientale TaxID=63057 RepID=A0A2P5EPG4_TREOI|nr:hypothetical protein TorRG33x02_168060 [Trema orientale]